MKLRWTVLAQRSRRAQINYIAERNPTAAIRLNGEIDSQIDDLYDHPMMGRAGRVQGTRELVISRTPYLAIYRLDPGEAVILRVIHHLQRWPPRPRKRR